MRSLHGDRTHDFDPIPAKHAAEVLKGLKVGMGKWAHQCDVCSLVSNRSGVQLWVSHS